MSLIQAAALLGAYAASVSAHGHVQGIVADGTYYEGYNPSFQYMSDPPAVIGWSCPDCLDNGFVSPDAYSNSNITCHKDATPGQASAKVAAGGKVELQWTVWPESHHGPVLDYLASCDGDCTTVEKDSLSFFKIDAGGLVDDTTVPGTWASDQLIANNNSWTVTIPSSIAPGNYVLRHEIIALHSAGQEDGAQNYPQCINLEVTGSGTDKPSGVAGTALYKPTDAGILVNIYQSLTYEIPGPTLYSGAESASQTGAVSATASVAASATSAAVSSQAPSSSNAPTSVAAVEVSSSVEAASSIITPASSIAEAISIVTADSTTTTTTEIDVTITGNAPSAAASSVAPIISQIANITSALPSGLLTSALPTALPTGSNSTGAFPSSPLPAGFTLKDLLEWVSYIMSTMFREGKERHPRDFVEKRQFGQLTGFPSISMALPAGAFPSGAAAPSGQPHHHPHNGGSRPFGPGMPSGAAGPTGLPSGGFPMPTGLPSFSFPGFSIPTALPTGF